MKEIYLYPGEYKINTSENTNPTLRNIAIILYSYCGQAVLWNLARELSSRLNVKYVDVEEALINIMSDYNTMSVEEADKRFDNTYTLDKSEKVW